MHLHEIILTSWVGPPPTSTTSPAIISPMTSNDLSMPKENSISPYTLTGMKLDMIVMTMKTVMNTAGFISGLPRFLLSVIGK